MTGRPTVVICPGGWPVRSFFEPLQRAFTGLAYPADIAITDYSAFDPLSPAAVNPDIASLQSHLQVLIETENKTVVLLMHSYGGVYGPASVKSFSVRERLSKGLEGGVLALIFCAAFNAEPGESAMDAQGFTHTEGGSPDWAHYDQATGLVALIKAKELLYHDLPEAEAEEKAKALPAMPIACFATKVDYSPSNDNWYRGAFGYVFCAQDKMLLYEDQKQFAHRAGVTRSRVLESSSHSPHLEQPSELAQLVVDVLDELVLDLKG